MLALCSPNFVYLQFLQLQKKNSGKKKSKKQPSLWMPETSAVDCTNQTEQRASVPINTTALLATPVQTQSNVTPPVTFDIQEGLPFGK